MMLKENALTQRALNIAPLQHLITNYLLYYRNISIDGAALATIFCLQAYLNRIEK